MDPNHPGGVGLLKIGDDIEWDKIFLSHFIFTKINMGTNEIYERKNKLCFIKQQKMMLCRLLTVGLIPTGIIYQMVNFVCGALTK